MFSEHITIFRIFSINIWLLKYQQRQINKTKNFKFFSVNFSKLSKFSSLSFWEKPFWNEKLLLLTATAWRSCYVLVRPFTMLSCFPFFSEIFLELIFTSKIKTIFLKQSAVLLTSCQKNIAYIMYLNT